MDKVHKIISETARNINIDDDFNGEGAPPRRMIRTMTTTNATAAIDDSPSEKTCNVNSISEG
jgi:hypothetical protein